MELVLVCLLLKMHADFKRNLVLKIDDSPLEPLLFFGLLELFWVLLQLESHMDKIKRLFEITLSG